MNNPYFVLYQQKYEVKGRTRLSDYCLRTKIIPELQHKATTRQLECLKTHNNWSFSLDGWSEGIVAVMLVDGRARHYIGILDITLSRHSADNYYLALENLLGNKFDIVKGIVTDSPNVMKALRKMVTDSHPHIVNIPCALHVLNLV